MGVTSAPAAFDCSSYDTPDNEAQVDFPASYVNTVAVGGTTLTPNQPEIAWYDSGFGRYLGDGSGGGERDRNAYLARMFPDFAALSHDGEFARLVDALLRPLRDAVGKPPKAAKASSAASSSEAA